MNIDLGDITSYTYIATSGIERKNCPPEACYLLAWFVHDILFSSLDTHIFDCIWASIDSRDIDVGQCLCLCLDRQFEQQQPQFYMHAYNWKMGTPEFNPIFSIIFSLSLSLSHTHTHILAQAHSCAPTPNPVPFIRHTFKPAVFKLAFISCCECHQLSSFPAGLLLYLRRQRRELETISLSSEMRMS